MTAYIEYVILDNFFMDLLLVVITLDILKIKKNKLLIFISCVFGTFCAVITPIISFKLASIIRIIQAPIMCIMMSKITDFKSYILQLLVFLLITFAIGGMAMALFNMSSSQLFYNNYNKGGILAVTAISVLIIYYTLKQLILRYKVKNINNHLNVILISNGHEKDFRGLYDTGNCLYYNNEPIIVLSSNIYNNLNLTKQNYEIKIKTVNGENLSELYLLDKLKIIHDKKTLLYENINCIISKSNLKSFDLILHKDLI